MKLPSIEEEHPDRREVNTMNANRIGFNPAVPNSFSSTVLIRWFIHTNGID